MYSRMMQIINASDSRYLSADEQEKVLTFAASMPTRIQVSRLVEQKEEEIVGNVINEMKKRWVNFPSLHDRAWEKGFRDIQLVLRYAVQGMLMDDLDMASDKLLLWFRTIVASVGMTPKFMRDTYTFLKDSCKQKLPADAFHLMEPHLNKTIEVMSDIPEPYKPAV